MALSPQKPLSRKPLSRKLRLVNRHRPHPVFCVTGSGCWHRHGERPTDDLKQALSSKIKKKATFSRINKCRTWKRPAQHQCDSSRTMVNPAIKAHQSRHLSYIRHELDRPKTPFHSTSQIMERYADGLVDTWFEDLWQQSSEDGSEQL